MFRRAGGPAVRGIAGGLLFALGWIAGLRTLFASADYRCAAIANGAHCTSDVVTLTEALVALALLALGCAAAVLLTRDPGADIGTLNS
jgi:hypothetical protein